MKRTEKDLENVMKEIAKKEGQEYFDTLKNRIKGLLDEVKSNEKTWKLAMRNGTAKNGYTPDDRVKVDAITRAMDSVRNFQFNNGDGQAVRAVARITKYYDVDC